MIQLRDYQEDLVSKVRASFRSGKRSPCIVLGCGGGKTVIFAYMAEQSQRKNNIVWFLVHRKELLDQTIETFDRFGIERSKIYIEMVGSVSRNLEKLPRPDFIIFDECHFSAAKTWTRIIEAFPQARIAGLTATPSRLDGKPLGDIYDDLIEGESVTSLIDRGFLSPYEYYAPSVADLSSLKKTRGDFNAAQAAEILNSRIIFGDVIAHYRRYADQKRAICYCATISHSQAMAAAFCEAGIRAVHFDGDTPKKERERIVQDFRDGKITILCNVDLISVGFDCPDVDCCILLRPTASTALYIQQACRALRFREGKTAIILDHVSNYIRHGLPDDPREWSLDKKIKKKKKDETSTPIRQCEECFAVMKAATRICPMCGAEIKVEQKELEEMKEIELQNIKKEETAITLDYRDPEDCKSLKELQQLAKNRGYKSGWAWIKAKQMGIIK